jgi:hypothetical protein
LQLFEGDGGIDLGQRRDGVVDHFDDGGGGGLFGTKTPSGAGNHQR